MATPPTPARANTVGWYILEGYPWWPVYICDQFKLRPHLYTLGDGHKKILKKARDFHRDYALVYYFGSHDFSLVKLNKGILKPWDCSEKEQYLKGHPKHLLKKGSVADELSFAIQEAEDYLSQPEDMRLPPHMVPSDLDPTLEPPPPMERPEEPEDADADDDGKHASDADGGGDDDEDADADMDHDGIEDEDGDNDDDAKKKPKKTKKEPKKKASTKKEKSDAAKKPKKEKKEKKPANEKREKKPATPKEKKESSSASKKNGDDADSKPTKIKRQRSSGGGDDLASDAKSKQAKGDKAADVKSSPSGGGGGGGEQELDLEAVLDREIRWILSNEQYEEMTTKMLRKVLEERLKRDLKQHRETIKAVVTRVIEEEEDTAAACGGGSGDQAAAAPPPAAAAVEGAAANGKSDADNDVKMQEEVPTKTEPTPEPHDVKAAAATNGSADNASLEGSAVKEEKVNKEEAVGDEPMKKEQDGGDTTEAAAEAPPPPKPVDEADILAIKDKLVDDKTSHEELLTCLNELQQMPLDISHLKQTGIARVVAKLRQHANDKVSISAKELRNTWMELVEKDKQPKSLKMLEKLRDTLDSEAESDAAKLAVLQELDKLSLTTQEIIDAKIGVSISKLRKASHADLAQAANSLRQKWKRLAQAS